MQSLDIAYFQPVKHYHRKAINEAVRLGATKFPLVEFFSAFGYIRAQAFKRETIISAFEQTGIYPLNTEKVIGPLRAKQETAMRAHQISNPASDPAPSSPISEVEYTTPQKVADVESSITHIHGLMIQHNMDPQILAAFEKMRKSAIIELYEGEQAAEQLHDIEIAKEARETQSKQDKKIIAHAKGGPIYVEQARAIMQTREQI
jgi:hypothetical protein